MATQFEPLDVDDGDEKAALAHASILEDVLYIFRRADGGR